MANGVLPIPPTSQPLFDQNYKITTVWQNYFLSLENIGGSFAPTDARYVVTEANTTLSDEVNLGLLASGYLKQTQAIGIATVSTTPTIPVADLNGTITLAKGGTAADLSATGGAHEVLRQSAGGAPVTVSQLATSDISGIAASTYTPTLTGVANVAASTAYAIPYVRIGSTVFVSGRVSIDPTAGATLTRIGISLPVASNFASAENCGGTAYSVAPNYSGAIFADAANDRAELDYTTAADVANQDFFFTFGYVVI